MHRMPIRFLALMLIVLCWAVVPAVTPASATSSAAQTVTWTGTLVATPAAQKPPISLLMQMGSSTVLVKVGLSTRLLESDGAAFKLGDMHDGDSLKVTGSVGRGGAFVASVVRDLSLASATIVHTKGQLASVQPGLICVANAQMTVESPRAAQVQPASSCPSGQLSISLSSTSLYENTDGTRVPLTDLRVGDTLQVKASLIGGRLWAMVVRDYSLLPEITVHVKGALASMPSPATVTPAGTLCLSNAQMTTTSPRAAQAQATTACPAGQLAVTLASTTRLVNHLFAPITMASLRQGDNLAVNGVLRSGQLLATRVEDLSL